MSSFSESHTSHGRARHQIRDWSESGRSRELLTPGTSDSCRPRDVVTRDFSAIFDRLFDRLPVRISTSDLHHWILRKKIFHIRAYDFGVQFSFKPHSDKSEIGAMLLFFMPLKSATIRTLYLLTYIICASGTPCDATCFYQLLPYNFSIASAIWKAGGYAIEEIAQSLRMLRVPLVTILARVMRLNFLNSPSRCCKCHKSQYWHEICDWNLLTKPCRCCEGRWSRYWREKRDSTFSTILEDVASAACHNIGTKFAIEKVVSNPRRWCECR